MKHAVWVFALLVVTGFAVVSGCATNPVTGKREISLVSEDQLLSMGKDGYQAVIKEYGAYDSQELAAYVDAVGQKLAKVSHAPNMAWKFTLLDDTAVNAFAMPGGYIYITRGILAHLGSEAQLAGVLGHEIGHVTARHSAQQITQQQLTGIGLGVAGIVSPTFRRYGQAAQQALGLIFLKYSRDHENQADQLGVDYATAAGYDPREIPNTYVMLRRVGEQAGSQVPEFLSTHPDPGNREVRTTELSKAAAAGKTGLVISGNAYIQRLEHLTFGPDPLKGYFEGTTFYHPVLKFQVEFPSGWQTQNTHSTVAAGAPDQSGTIQLTLVPSDGKSPGDYVRSLVSNNKVSDARGNDETIGGYPAWLGQLAIQTEEGPLVLVAALIAKEQGQLYQIVGRASDPQLVSRTARSFRDLTDSKRINVKADYVDVVTLERSGSFSEVVPTLGKQALDLTRTSILNNVELDEGVAKGTLLKVVRPGIGSGPRASGAARRLGNAGPHGPSGANSLIAATVFAPSSA